MVPDELSTSDPLQKKQKQWKAPAQVLWSYCSQGTQCRRLSLYL